MAYWNLLSVPTPVTRNGSVKKPLPPDAQQRIRQFDAGLSRERLDERNLANTVVVIVGAADVGRPRPHHGLADGERKQGLLGLGPQLRLLLVDAGKRRDRDLFRGLTAATSLKQELLAAHPAPQPGSSAASLKQDADADDVQLAHASSPYEGRPRRQKPG